MGEFYITKVVAKGSGKTDSVIDLRPGLNIIQGRPNTGKTCIIKCIDFCFGSNTKPFDDNLGYDTVELSFNTYKGNITIKRELDKNYVNVETNVIGFESGKYNLIYTNKKDPLPILSDLLLNSIGIEGDHYIIRDEYLDKKRLTWQTILHLLLFHVEDIAKEQSIIEPELATERISLFSALLFLIYGRDLDETEAQTKREIRVAQEQAVEEYINKKIRAISDKRKGLLGDLSKFEEIDVEQSMQDIINSMQSTEKQISVAVDQNREILSQILRLQNMAAECDLLKSRYASLKTQYVSDVKRLCFIVNGEVEMGQIPQNQKCPFCDGKLMPQNKKSYIDAAQAELDRITIQIDGLAETEKDLEKEKSEIDLTLKELKTKRDNLEVMIENELQPKATALRKAINKYRTFIQIKQELSVVDDFVSSWKSDLKELQSEGETQVEHKLKEWLSGDFQERINRILKGALVGCNYDSFTTVQFDMNSFDITVDGQKKANIHEQGYRSYLNTIVALAFRRYMELDAKYNPGFVIIDTPLLGLNNGTNDSVLERMKTGLFEYLINHQNEGQVIILENKSNVPDLDYEQNGVNVITFTKRHKPGRCGFLNDVE